MAIKVQPNGEGSLYPLSTSPFSISCIVSTTDPSKTTLTGSGTTNAIAGIVDKFTVTLFDTGNN